MSERVLPQVQRAVEGGAVGKRVQGARARV